MMTDAEFILACSFMEVALALQPVRGVGRDGRGLAIRRRHDRAKQGWTPYKPADWSSIPLSPKDRKDIAAALRDLEAAGLVEVERDGTNRPTWLRLLPKGQAKGKAIAKREDFDVPTLKAEEPPLETLNWFAGMKREVIKDMKDTVAAGMPTDIPDWVRPSGKDDFLNWKRKQFDELPVIIAQEERKLALIEAIIADVKEGKADGREAVSRVLTGRYLSEPSSPKD
jgi:DNA-binding MarR family transcriptional regulator